MRQPWTRNKLRPVHPGEFLHEEFSKPMGLSQNKLALDIGVPPRRINEIVLGKRGITADTALRLAPNGRPAARHESSVLNEHVRAEAFEALGSQCWM